MYESLDVSGGGPSGAAPTIHLKGKYAHDKIADLLRWYSSVHYEECDAFAKHCASLRGGAEWTGTFSPVIYNSKEKDMAWDVKIPERLNFHMTRLFHSMWLDDKEIFDEFCKQWVIGRIRGIPKPDPTGHLGK